MIERSRPITLAPLLFAAALLSACATPTVDVHQAQQIIASPDRAPGDRINDLRRKPADILAFLAVRPGMTALDVSAGRGYTSELLTRAVGPTGKVYAQTAPRREAARPPAQPEGAAAPPPPTPASPMPTLAERTTRFPNLIAIQRPFEDPAPPEAEGKLDLVTLMFNYHDFGHLGVDRARTNAAIYKALKPGGVYVIADHSGRPGTGISESGTLHRVEEAFVRREVEAAGFRFAGSGEFLRNPADPRDRNTPEPPMPKDEFVLKFVKP
ncbi:class I SAM-dependent methyltransferase [Ramlibacter albus]|uniref:Class I SAM-dependent methyltransferase n=1 Tax=Ramlibacter albus TaxID=2079448 RepID=A0A923MDN3_9BURK|nr:class I SAM-dependent methyltransferase [Ramlibacter albus]MBC5768100.1 class I SAM-dependent methyltransferase [Ramlibacter albus]